MKKPSAPNLNLYPELPEATEQVDQGVQFRLNKIFEIRDFLENESTKETSSEESTRQCGTYSITRIKFQD